MNWFDDYTTEQEQYSLFNEAHLDKLSNLDKSYLELELLVDSIDSSWTQNELKELHNFMSDFYDEYTNLVFKVEEKLF